MGERESAGDNQIRASSKERMTSQCRPARWALTPAISFRCWLWILFLSLRRLPDSPAQRIHCLNNVKQLALGSFMYASDHSRHAGVEAPAFPGGNWMGTLNEYAKEKGMEILLAPGLATARHQAEVAVQNLPDFCLSDFSRSGYYSLSECFDRPATIARLH